MRATKEYIDGVRAKEVCETKLNRSRGAENMSVR